MGDVNLRFRVIAALSRLRKLHPQAEVDRQAIEMVLAAEIMGHYRSYQILGTIGEAFAGDDPVVAGLRHSMEQERERIFRLTGLLRNADDVESAYEGLSATSSTVRANALELLDNVLSPDLRRLLVPLVDPQVSVGERIERANKIVGAPVQSREEAVEALIASDDPWLRSCGVYAVGALRLTSFSDAIDKFADADDPLLRETVRAAKERLAGARRSSTCQRKTRWRPAARPACSTSATTWAGWGRTAVGHQPSPSAYRPAACGRRPRPEAMREHRTDAACSRAARCRPKPARAISRRSQNVAIRAARLPPAAPGRRRQARSRASA